jgi:hypothetical protein
MKEIILLIFGSVLTQSVQEIYVEPELRFHKKQIKKEIRLIKKEVRLQKKIKKFQSKLERNNNKSKLITFVIN